MIWHGNWNVRKFALSGKSKEYNLYFVRALEMASQLAKKEWNSSVTIQGKRSLPDFGIIVDISGYTLREGGCLACKYVE